MYGSLQIIQMKIVLDQIYTIEHPKGSGKTKTYKEVVSHKFLDEAEAKEKLIDAQFDFIIRIKKNLTERNLIY